MSNTMLLLVFCVFFPLLSFALPSSHTRSFHSHRPRIMTYYPDWAPPESFDCSLFDVVIFAFALPDQTFQLAWDSKRAPDLLASLVPAAHAASSLVMLSIGGWTGSKHFSDAVSTPQNREIFTNNILDIYRRYDLDGIDIDWEYPGQIAQQGNGESALDSTNMLQFFEELHRKLPSRAMISAAVQDSTFVGPNGQPMKDVSRYSDLLDWVTLMNYDAFENRHPPGPNAALSDGCHNSSLPNANAASAYKAWTSAGFPPPKVVLGVPTYGYIIDSDIDARRLSTRSPIRAFPEDGSGQVQFRSLITQGILVQHPDGSFQGSAGFVRRWDNCSATPFLRSDSAGQVISYDDDRSLGMKAAWVKDMGMGGVNLFDAHGDTSRHHLTRAVRAVLLPPSTQSSISPSAAISSVTMLPPSPIPSSSSPVLSLPSAYSSLASPPHPSSTPLPPLLGGIAVLTHRH